MIGVIGSWVKTLIVIVLLGNLAEFVLPKGDLRRYTGLVVGLILLLAMISPVWSILHSARPSLIQQDLLGTNSSQGLHQVIRQEEWNQAKAMVLTYPGVTGCTIQQSGSRFDVTVKTTGKPNLTQLRHYINDALQVAMGTPEPISANIRILDAPPPASRSIEMARHKEG